MTKKQLTETEGLEIQFDLDGILFNGPVLVSIPPPGSFRIANLYVSPAGKLVVEYSDRPVE